MAEAPTSRVSLVLAATACFTLLGIVASAAGAPDPSPLPSCIANKCFTSDFFGGLGLKPKRQYIAVYGNSELCKQALKQINAAILAGRKSLKAVQLPLPEAARTEQPIWAGEPTKEYETRNPIFAGDMFLPWNLVNASPGPYPPGMRPTEEEQKDDEDRARWLIAPVFNDGKPLLLTQVLGLGVTVWDVPQDQLNKHDWSDWHSYRDFKPKQSICEFDPNRPVDPFSGFVAWCPDSKGEYGRMYPRLKYYTKKPIYSPPDRVLSIFVFALFDGKYYTVLQAPNQDMISVTDNGSGLPPPEDYGKSRASADLCYLAPESKWYR